MSKSLHQYINPNPLKKETGDCVFRACSIATGKDWDTVYRDLFEIGFELKVPPSMKEAYETYLAGLGFKYTGISNKKGSKRPTVEQMAKLTKGNDRVIVCRVANHVVTVKGGSILDTWDSGDCSLYGYWELHEDVEA